MILLVPCRSMVNSPTTFDATCGDLIDVIRRIVSCPLWTNRLQLTHWAQDKPSAGSSVEAIRFVESILVVASFVTKKGILYKKDNRLHLLAIWKNLDDRSSQWCFTRSGAWPRKSAATPSNTTTDMDGWLESKWGNLCSNKSKRSSWFRTQLTKILERWLSSLVVVSTVRCCRSWCNRFEIRAVLSEPKDI